MIRMSMGAYGFCPEALKRHVCVSVCMCVCGGGGVVVMGCEHMCK